MSEENVQTIRRHYEREAEAFRGAATSAPASRSSGTTGESLRRARRKAPLSKRLAWPRRRDRLPANSGSRMSLRAASTDGDGRIARNPARLHRGCQGQLKTHPPAPPPPPSRRGSGRGRPGSRPTAPRGRTGRSRRAGMWCAGRYAAGGRPGAARARSRPRSSCRPHSPPPRRSARGSRSRGSRDPGASARGCGAYEGRASTAAAGGDKPAAPGGEARAGRCFDRDRYAERSPGSRDPPHPSSA
jgi:hypothetical protein